VVTPRLPAFAASAEQLYRNFNAVLRRIADRKVA